METTNTTVVTQLINRGRAQVGDVTAVQVPGHLFEAVYAEVVDAGGDAGFEHCVVDGVRVTAVEGDVPRVVPAHGGAPVTLDED